MPIASPHPFICLWSIGKQDTSFLHVTVHLPLQRWHVTLDHVLHLVWQLRFHVLSRRKRNGRRTLRRRWMIRIVSSSFNSICTKNKHIHTSSEYIILQREGGRNEYCCHLSKCLCTGGVLYMWIYKCLYAARQIGCTMCNGAVAHHNSSNMFFIVLQTCKWTQYKVYSTVNCNVHQFT